MIKVVDNFLSPSYFEFIEHCCRERLEWTYAENITDDLVDNKSQFGFSVPIHSMNGPIESAFRWILSGFLHTTLDYVKGEKILRSRCDMTLYNPNKFMHVPHVDFEDPYVPNITTIFYITDNEDSETVIFDRKLQEDEDKSTIDFSKVDILKKVDPKRNRLVVFDGNYLHTGHSPTRENRRVLINSNFS
jgi:hypothetical protein